MTDDWVLLLTRHQEQLEQFLTPSIPFFDHGHLFYG